jgi:ABC-2 type transport system ATP-binding protein
MSHPGLSGPPSIQVRGLRKTYGDLVAVDGVDVSAFAGEIFGLLGPNGAGKSTLIGCASGLLTPSAGTVTMLGHDVSGDGPAARRQLGVVPQELALYEDLSARDNLGFWGAAYGLSGRPLRHRVDEVLHVIGLGDRGREPVKRFSGGMKRRLNFGCGIVHEPKVLLLDEPTVGVDPQSRVKLLELVRAQAAAGACVLYTTHYMEEAQSLCDRLTIIDQGKVLAAGTLAELRGRLGEKDLVRLTGTFPKPRAPELLQVPGAEFVSADNAGITLAVPHASRVLPAIFAAVTGAGGTIHDATISQPSLESLFIALTGRDLRE